MSTQNLKKLVKELVIVEKRATMDLEIADWKTLPSLSILKTESKERLEVLRKEYLKAVRSNSLGIFLYGEESRCAKFVELTPKEADTYPINASEMYDRLASKVAPTLGPNKEFGPTQLEMLIGALDEIQRELGVRQMIRPSLRNTSAVMTDFKSVSSEIRRILKAVVGNDLLRLYVDKQVNDIAIKNQFAGVTLPVIVLGAEPDEAAGLSSLFTNTSSVQVGTPADGEVTAEYVLEQFNNIKEKLRPGATKTAKATGNQ